MRTLTPFSFLLCLTTTACSSQALSTYGVTDTVDEFTQGRRSQMDNNVLAGGGLGGARVELNFGRVDVAESDTTVYTALAEYEWSGWMFIESGGSLTFLVDGEPVSVSTETALTRRDVLRGGDVRERAIYTVPVALIRRLAAASEVKVRLQGSRYNMDREFDDSNFTRLRGFISTHVDDEPATAPPR